METKSLSCAFCGFVAEGYFILSKDFKDVHVYVCQDCRKTYADSTSAKYISLVTKERWIELYGGQALLDSEGFEVVPCEKCEDHACRGWRVQRVSR